MMETDLMPLLRLLENIPRSLEGTLGQNEASSHRIVSSCKNYAREVNSRMSEMRVLRKEERPLQIGLVGGFSTGKSSIINSLLGREILGVEIKPATAKPTQISYGSRLKIEKVMVGGKVEEIDLESFSEMSNHPPQGTTSKFEEVSSFRLEYPSDNLKKFIIVDTPGFFSLSEKDDEITLQQMDRMDLFLWIFDLQNPGHKKEADLLKKISSKKIIGVLNKCEGKPPSGREKQKKELLKVFSNFDSIFFYSSKKVLKFQMEQLEQERDIELLIANIKKHVDEGTANFSFNQKGYCINGDLEKQFNLKFPNDNEFYRYYIDLISRIEEIERIEKEELFRKAKKERDEKLQNFVHNVLDDLSSQIEELFEETNKEILLKKKKEQNFIKDFHMNKQQLRLKLEEHHKKFVSFLSLSLFNRFFLGESNSSIMRLADATRTMQKISVRHFYKCMEYSDNLLKVNDITAKVNNDLKESKVKALKITGDTFCRTLYEEHFKTKKFPSGKTEEYKKLIKTILPNEEIRKLVIEFAIDHFTNACHSHNSTDQAQLKRLKKDLSVIVEIKRELESQSHEWRSPTSTFFQTA